MERMQEFDWKAALTSGIIAGALFLILELVMVPVFGGGSPWGPPRMIAGIVMGEGVATAPATFDFGIVLVAVIVHFALSIIYAFIFALIIGRMNYGPAMLVGAFGGLVLYLVNFYGFTYFFPWFAAARNWITIFSHLVFGVMAAFVYVEMTHLHTGEKTITHLRMRKV